MLSVRLPPKLKNVSHFWLEKLGEPTAIMAVQRSLRKIEDLEDACEATLERIRQGKERILKAEEMWGDLDD
ncbi:MAG: hypothetical protein OXE94_06460 [Aestuariivita sp.]|nr:hypothetical protein [Aestuariivita sp.]MCY4347546.1 hypothetical protein [Aestuariivita sp.]